MPCAHQQDLTRGDHRPANPFGRPQRLGPRRRGRHRFCKESVNFRGLSKHLRLRQYRKPALSRCPRLNGGAINIGYFRGFLSRNSRRRTPGPPPFPSSGQEPCRGLRAGLFATLLLRFAQPYARASAILIDELDAGGPQCLLDQLQRPRVSGISSHLNVVDGVSMKASLIRKISHSPI